MDILEEVGKETKELLLDSLVKRTLSGKQKWVGLNYKPISFMEENEEEENDALICHIFEMETEFNGRNYTLEVTEQIDFPSGKGDIFGTLSYKSDKWEDYKFALSFDERYHESDAEHLKEVFADSLIVKLMESVVFVFEETEAVSFGFSCAWYYGSTDNESKWNQMPLVRLGKKLTDEKRMKDFHRIVLDMDYREKLLEEIQ